MLNRDEALSWFLLRRAGSVPPGKRRPCLEPGWCPAPPNTPCAEPEQQTSAPCRGSRHRASPAAVPASHWEGGCPLR